MDYANMCENVIARKNPALILCVLARNFADRYLKDEGIFTYLNKMKKVLLVLIIKTKLIFLF